MSEVLTSRFNGLNFNRPSGLSDKNWASVKGSLLKTEGGRLFDSKKFEATTNHEIQSEKKGKSKVFNGVSFSKDDKDSSVEKKETPKNESFVE